MSENENVTQLSETTADKAAYGPYNPPEPKTQIVTATFRVDKDADGSEILDKIISLGFELRSFNIGPDYPYNW